MGCPGRGWPEGHNVIIPGVLLDVLNDAEVYRQPRDAVLSKEEHWFRQHVISQHWWWPYRPKDLSPVRIDINKYCLSVYYPPKVVAQRSVLNPLVGAASVLPHHVARTGQRVATGAAGFAGTSSGTLPAT